jgi:hypothetical protein
VLNGQGTIFVSHQNFQFLGLFKVGGRLGGQNIFFVFLPLTASTRLSLLKGLSGTGEHSKPDAGSGVSRDSIFIFYNMNLRNNIVASQNSQNFLKT